MLSPTTQHYLALRRELNPSASSSPAHTGGESAVEPVSGYVGDNVANTQMASAASDTGKSMNKFCAHNLNNISIRVSSPHPFTWIWFSCENLFRKDPFNNFDGS